MSEMKRIPIKWLRDKAKSLYAYRLKTNESRCEVCNTENSLENPLEAHHYHTLSAIYNKWLKDNNVGVPDTDEAAIEIRDKIIHDYNKEIVEESEIAILCRACHTGNEKSILYRNKNLDIKFRGSLHGVYGKMPTLATAEKQKRWVKKMRAKLAAKYPQLNIT